MELKYAPYALIKFQNIIYPIPFTMRIKVNIFF